MVNIYTGNNFNLRPL